MQGYYKRSLVVPGESSLPLISIVTVVFNGENSLEKTIQSLLAQNYDNVEYIVIDGGSTDGTLAIIREYEERIDYWVSEPDRGLYDAMNKGIQLSSGELIGLLNSDDLYDELTLQKVRDTYLAETEENRALVIAGSIGSVDRERGVQIIVDLSRDFLKNIDYNMPVHHPATFLERKVYERIGLFNIDYKISSDYDLIFRCYRDPGVKFVYLDHVLTRMSKGGLSMRLESLWVNLQENFSIRKAHQVSAIDNLKHSLKWLVTEFTVRLFKMVLNDRAIALYYKIRYRRILKKA